jgi:hypothetical protein
VTLVSWLRNAVTILNPNALANLWGQRVMRWISVLAIVFGSWAGLQPTEISAGPVGGFETASDRHRSSAIVLVSGRGRRNCCSVEPFVYSYPTNLPTFAATGTPYYFDPNLYYYRNYYPYPRPPILRAPPHLYRRGILFRQ